MIRIRRATSGDVNLVLDMHAEASEWLASKGKDQWQPDAVGKRTRDRVRESIEKATAERACWLAFIGSDLVGTITVDSHADPEFWTPADQPETALYIHRMIVRRKWSGRGIGKVLLSLAEQLARTAGKRWVRLDAWSTNEELHAYYESVGFESVRKLRFDHRGSGALFQRSVPPSAKSGDFWDRYSADIL